MTDAVQPRDAIARENEARLAIARAAETTGADFDALLATARRESSLDANARAGTSSAAGMFQFIESTWLDMVRRHGADHGLGPYAQALQSGSADAATRREILNLRFDPEISARMAGELWRENAAALEARIGRAPTESELYAAHVMGPAGAARLIQAAQRGAPCAADIFPREAAANRGLFYDRTGAARSAQDLLDKLSLDASGGGALPAPTLPRAATDYLTKTTPLSPALLDALFALALSPRVESEDSDPALELLKR